MTTAPGTDARRPLVLLDTAPQPVERIFTPGALDRLRRDFEVRDVSGDPVALDELLPEAFAVVGQSDLPAERLGRAAKLRAIMNVEGNFYPNIDYPTAFARGVRVLGCGPAYAQPVAEYALGLALDLARGISREDRAFREGRERYLGDGNADAVVMRHAEIGLIGYGNLGRALHTLLRGFSPRIRVFDPWLPEASLRQADVEPATLEEILATSQFLFVLAAVTDANRKLLDAERLASIREGARVVLVSRAAIVDYDALVRHVDKGQFLAAVDVWPEEPVAEHHPARTAEGFVLSAHRAGGIPSAFTEIGDMVIDDLTLLARGLPPVRMQAAAPELVGRYRNKPAG
ncbi:MAG: hydroxyacid dehydrogenase [Marmoricola sp.]|nr:hydroxyacid dehydrogenase [Marmoricola sp.]